MNFIHGRLLGKLLTHMNLNCTKTILLAASLAVAVGCGLSEPEFRRYETWRFKVEKSLDEKDRSSPELKREIDESLAALFGTPNSPAIPPSSEAADVSKLLDPRKLSLSAGPIGSDQQGNPHGLYRKHCVHCHGLTGDGNGPTASFLNPYPRDYRPGKFKFKSTPLGAKPTHDDLHRVLVNGIAGTAMPSFRLLTEAELESLIQYVQYLSIRGEVERQLIKNASELGKDEHLISTKTADSKAQQEVYQAQLEGIKTLAADVVSKWLAAETAATAVPARATMEGKELAESQKRGRELFYGKVANCFSCHGDSSLGDGVVNDYDDWVKEFIDKEKSDIVQKYVSLGMPKPRNIRPRNLRQGVFRGGLRPVDIFWRVRNGIEGSPMPGNQKLTPNEIWDVVNYVQSLPYESVSDPRQAEPVNMRERN